MMIPIVAVEKVIEKARQIRAKAIEQRQEGILNNDATIVKIDARSVVLTDEIVTLHSA
jgi:hypothetical protein